PDGIICDTENKRAVWTAHIITHAMKPGRTMDAHTKSFASSYASFVPCCRHVRLLRVCMTMPTDFREIPSCRTCAPHADRARCAPAAYPPSARPRIRLAARCCE